MEVHWRTLRRQPWSCKTPEGTFRLAIQVAKQKGDRVRTSKVVYSTDFRAGGWATEAAALAARPGFKKWVDSGMNKQQRLAQKESVIPRAAAGLAALLKPPDPTRASTRNQVRPVHLRIDLKVVGGKVKLVMTTTSVIANPDSSNCWDKTIHYHKRSAAAQQRATKRRKRELVRVAWRSRS